MLDYKSLVITPKADVYKRYIGLSATGASKLQNVDIND